jgi:hypothetical protein
VLQQLVLLPQLVGWRKMMEEDNDYFRQMCRTTTKQMLEKYSEDEGKKDIPKFVRLCQTKFGIKVK